MSFDSKTKVCLCERCGYAWTTSQENAPRSCGKCKSKVWNQPRVYAGKYISGTLARRFKPTGRAAANLRPEKIRAERLDDLTKRLRYVRREFDNTRDALEDAEYWKYDRAALGYYFKTISQEIDRLTGEISTLEN